MPATTTQTIQYMSAEEEETFSCITKLLDCCRDCIQNYNKTLEVLKIDSYTELGQDILDHVHDKCYGTHIPILIE